MTARHTLKRLKGFDYTKPYFYMVTLKRMKGLKPFCEITKEAEPPKDAEGRPRYLIANAITAAFAKVIREFHTKWWGLWPIECFIVMPDHLHLLIHIKDTGDQMALGKYVYQLMKALTEAYWRVVGTGDGERGGRGRPDNTRIAGQSSSYQRVVLPAPSGNIPPAPSGNDPSKPPPVFARDWHDWIVKKDGQLAAFTRYIRENPERAWLRQQNRRYFGQVRKVSFLGHEWFAYGNLAILALPVLKAVKGHRATKPETPEWNALVEECARLGPGDAGVGNEAEKKLLANYRLFLDEDEIDKYIAAHYPQEGIAQFAKLEESIRDRYLLNVPRFGSYVRSKDIKEFKNEVDALKQLGKKVGQHIREALSKRIDAAIENLYKILEAQWAHSRDPWYEEFRRKHPKEARDRHAIFVAKMKAGTKGTDALIEKFTPEIDCFSTPIDDALSDNEEFMSALCKMLYKRNRTDGKERIHVEDLITLLPKATATHSCSQEHECEKV